jgi:predicted PurR-regulated permease PerM
MNKMKCKKEMRIVFGILFVFGMILTVGKGTLDSVYGQINSTINQTNTPSTTNTNTTNTNTTNTASPAITTSAEEEASESIKGAITETGSLLRNITEKVATSKSAGAILNETSEVLGNAYIEAKKFLSPN